VNKVKKIISVIGISLALLFTGLANAEIKIGVINVRSVMERMPERETIVKELNQKFEARIKSLAQEEKAANAADARLKKEGLTLSPSEKAKLAKTISDFQKKATAFSEEYHENESKGVSKLLLKIQEAVNKIVAEEKYDLILKEEATLYTSDAVDITDKVLERVKK
jgi:outer membrane protein